MIRCDRCGRATSKLTSVGLCLDCAGRAVVELRAEVCRLQETNNELVRELWRRQPGERTAEGLT